MDIAHRTIEANGIRMHVAEAGAGPLVVLCHGFPECWYSWKDQIIALAEAGYHAVAPDMRGYGQTDAPEEVDQYTILHLVGDIMGLLDALGAPQAVIVGHDWGAPVAWHCALLRPDRVRGVAGLSVPFFPRTSTRPSLTMPHTPDSYFYQAYFCDGRSAESEFNENARKTLRNFSWLWSGDYPDNSLDGQAMVRRGQPMFEGRAAPPTLPAWVTETDIDVYAQAFANAGFGGPLNWYRNIDRNWELTAPWKGAPIVVPALFMAGERDMVLRFKGVDRLIPNLERIIPRLSAKTILPQCGHWIQRERPDAVNQALLQFLEGLDRA